MLRRLNDWMRGRSSTTAGGNAAGDVRWRSILGVASIAAVAFCTVATLDFSTDDLIGEALFPRAGLRTPDDGAGDATTADAERSFPVPDAFADELVVAAFGPIAHLSCRRSDYEG